jgi:phenylalanyl-tRNA synthetase beta chain
MATITYSIPDLERYKIKKEDLFKLLDSIGMELEGVKGEEAEITVTPNRPELLDIVGLARALSLFTEKKTPKEDFYTVKNEPAMEVEVGKHVKRIRPFITAMVVKNADLTGNRLKYLINFTEKFCETYGRKRRKIAIGLHNLDVIKGPMVYDAARDKSFTPLGSAKEMTFEETMKSHAKGMEYGSILDAGNAKALYPFLADSRNVLALIPITNCELTRVKEGTKNLFIDITGTSANAINGALGVLACSFIDSGADVYPCDILYGNKRVRAPELAYREFRIKKIAIERTIGSAIDENRMIGLANKMGYPAVKYGNYMLVKVPPYRLDVLNEQDILEDMAIAYGYNKITPLPVTGFSSGIPEEYKVYVDGISKLMVGLGFSEAMNTYLTNEKLNFGNLMHEYKPGSVVSFVYSKTELATMLRTSILPQLLQNLSQSTHESMPQRLFETGNTYAVSGDKVGETVRLCFVSEHSKANFSEAKSVVESLMRYLNLGKYSIRECDDPSYIKGRCASIELDRGVLGCFGEIAPQVLGNFKLEEPVVAAEIRIDLVKRG